MTTAQDQHSRAEFEAWWHRQVARSDDAQSVQLKSWAWLAWRTARALPAAEPVAGQCRFVGEAAWLGCAAEHVRAVLAAPQDWEGYEVRYLYAEAPPPTSPLTDERIRQLDDETHFHEAHDWSVRFARRVEAEVREWHPREQS